MSTLSEHVSLTITQDSVGIARAGFGVPLILSCNASFAERVRLYSDLTSLADDGFATDSPEYLAAAAAFAQSPHPEQVAIGRAVGAPTLAYQINVTTVTEGATYGIDVVGEGVTATTVEYTTLADITFVDGDVTVGTDLIAETGHGMATGDGPFRVSNSGGALPTGLSVDTNYWVIATSADTYKLATSKADALANTPVDITAAAGGGTHTLRRNQNDVIVAQLVQGLNAVVGKNYTAAQVPGAGETDHLTVTGTAAGDWFSLEVSDVSLLKNQMTHAEPATALATDLNAIQLENSDWYVLVTLYNSDAYVKAAAAWVESADSPKLYAADLCASETATLAAGGGDTADDIETLAYTRTFICYHPSPADMFGAAWCGRLLPLDPGSETWKFKSLSGVNPVTTTSTHRTNIKAKKANSIITVAGRNITFEGTTADGDFIDIQRGLDWLEDDMTKAVFGALAGADKIPYTDDGVALIQAEVWGSLKRAVNMGILDTLEKDAVTVPRVASVSTANRALRLLPDVKFKCRTAGAIHKVNISGVVSV
jgi:hypothetical protein